MGGFCVRVAVLLSALLCLSVGAWSAVAEESGQRSQLEVARDLLAADVASKQYRIEEAVAIYDRLIDSETFPPVALAGLYLQRGSARLNYAYAYDLGDEAVFVVLQDFRKARGLFPSAATLVAEGNALVLLGAYADAKDAFLKARELEQPDPQMSLISLARVERILGHYDAALAHIDESFRLHGEAHATMPMYYHRGWILRLLGRYAEAVDAFTKGVPKQPTYHSVYLQRSCAYAQLGEFEKATEDAEHALELMDDTHSAEVKAWRETPYGKAFREDLAQNLATIEAMVAGTASDAQRASLCAATRGYGDGLRSISPRLSL